MYLAPQIDSILDSNKNRFLGEIPYSSLTRRLAMSFGYPKDLKFKIETYDDFDRDEFTISGLYDMTDNTKYIIVNLSNKCKKIFISRKDFRFFKFLVSQCIQHETIHQLQWQHRDCVEDPVKLDFRNKIGSINEERIYLSDIDEVDAYAHDIAMEIKFYYPKENPYNVLRKINRVRKIPSYSYFKETFRGCNWDRIRAMLLLKTYKWIPHA